MRAVKHMVATTKAPDKTGSFDGTIFYNPPEGDSDGERVENFINTPTTVPLDFHHLIVMDPGSVIGQIKAVEVGDGKNLAVSAQLSVGSKMADAVHERMLLPDDDPMVLKELSIAYAYDPSLNTKDANGVVAIHDAELLAISVVHAGAQKTQVINVKSELDVLEKTALAGLISVEQAMKYAEDLGVPGDISQKLFESAATAEGTKYMSEAEPPEGSYEEIQEDIREALEVYSGTDAYAYVVATFPDRVVACICASDGTEQTLQFPYTFEGDTVALGTPVEVEIEMSIVEAAKTVNLGTLHEHLMAASPRGHDMSAEEAQAETYASHDANHVAGHTHPTRLDPGVGTAKALGEKWDGAAAMRSCSSAADFRSIAFERANDSDPDTAAHWALPHHASPGAKADQGGVSAALAALHGGRGGAPDLKNAGAAEKHLQAHENSFGNSGKADDVQLSDEQLEAIAEKVGRVLGAKRVSDLKASLGNAIDEWAKTVNGDAAVEEKAEEIEELTAQLDELVSDQEQAEKAAEVEAKAEELASEVADEVEANAEAEKAAKAKAAEEEIADFRLQLDALELSG